MDLQSLVKKQKNLEDDFSNIQNRFLKYQYDQKQRSKRTSKLNPKNRLSAAKKTSPRSRSRPQDDKSQKITKI